jgi:sterol desaturase/sphingolipid hydroxylase (fatty acid hydroxylase superfamily)
MFSEWMLAHEVPIRLGFFFGVLLAMAVWEIRAPRRRVSAPKGLRWVNNLAIVFLNSLLLRWSFPVLAVGMAALGEDRAWGLLNNLLLPDWLAVALGVVALDLVIYLQHVLMHSVPALWRLHRMHHADLDFDVTTGARFHPVEILVSMAIKLAAVAALGPPALAVLIFEVLLNATSLFNHGNVRLPERVERVLRWFVVTPDMHRVHHSILRQETDSNFGFNLPWWDRLMGTYRAQPAAGHQGMTIGLPYFREGRFLLLPWMLLQPALETQGHEAAARRGGE